MKKTAIEWFYNELKELIKQSELTEMKPSEFDEKETKLLEQAKEMERQQVYSEEDMEIVEISSSDANYIQHYQTKEGQLLATKFNVKQFKNK